MTTNRPVFLALLLSCLIAILGCGDDCPTCPEVPELPADGIIQGDLWVSTQTQLELLVGLREVTGRFLIDQPSEDDPVVDLGPLADLERVGWLEISRSPLRDLTGLGSLAKAGRIELYNLDSLRSLDGLAALDSVSSFKLQGIPRLAEVDAIARIAQLQSLGVWHCDSLVSLDVFDHLPGLEYLDVSSCASLVEIPSTAMPELVSIRLYDLPALTALDITAPSLQSLVLYRLTAPEIQVELGSADGLVSVNLQEVAGIEDLAWLVDAPNLRSISIRNLPDLDSLQGLEQVPALQSLYVSECAQLASLAGLPDLVGLEGFGLASLPLLTTLDHLPALPGLARLSLYHLPALTSYTGLPAGLALESFQIESVPVTDLTSLPTMERCVSFSISNCSALVSLDGIAALQGMVTLRLDGNEALTDLDPGLDSGLDSVVELAVSRCNALTSLAGLGPLPHLSDLIVDFNDQLLDLSGPTYPAVIDRLEIRHNPQLASFAGTGDIQEITGWFNVDSNYALTSLTGLSSLERVHDVNFWYNIALGEGAIFALLAGVEVTGQVRVNGNHR